MTNNQLKYVITIAEYGSFSKAAKALYIAQPSLSNQIKVLEEELGTPLFIRMHHNLRLTEAGHDFVLYAKRILNELDNLQNLMQSYSSYSRGHLIIGALADASYKGLPESTVTFQKLYPRINVKFIMDTSTRLLELLMTQEIDIAILSAFETTLKENDLQYAELYEEDFVVVIPKGHPLSDHSSLQIKDLKKEKIILPQNGSHARLLIENKFLLQEETLTPCGQCSSTEGCIQLVSSGFGITITTASAAKKLKNDNFRIIPLLPPVRLKTYAVLLKTSYPGSIADEFFNYLQTQFRR